MFTADGKGSCEVVDVCTQAVKGFCEIGDSEKYVINADHKEPELTIREF
jgi:hypothetical protein